MRVAVAVAAVGLLGGDLAQGIAIGCDVRPNAVLKRSTELLTLDDCSPDSIAAIKEAFPRLDVEPSCVEPTSGCDGQPPPAGALLLFPPDECPKVRTTLSLAASQLEPRAIEPFVIQCAGPTTYQHQGALGCGSAWAAPAGLAEGEYAAIEFYRPSQVTSCGDGSDEVPQDGAAICNDGVRTFLKAVTAQGVEFSAETDYQLSRTGLFNNEPEVSMGGYARPVCAPFAGRTEIADVMCRQLGLKPPTDEEREELGFTAFAVQAAGGGVAVSCDGTEISLGDCTPAATCDSGTAFSSLTCQGENSFDGATVPAKRCSEEEYADPVTGVCKRCEDHPRRFCGFGQQRVTDGSEHPDASCSGYEPGRTDAWPGGVDNLGCEPCDSDFVQPYGYWNEQCQTCGEDGALVDFETGTCLGLDTFTSTISEYQLSCGGACLSTVCVDCDSSCDAFDDFGFAPKYYVAKPCIADPDSREFSSTECANCEDHPLFRCPAGKFRTGTCSSGQSTYACNNCTVCPEGFSPDIPCGTEQPADDTTAGNEIKFYGDNGCVECAAKPECGDDQWLYGSCGPEAIVAVPYECRNCTQCDFTVEWQRQPCTDTQPSLCRRCTDCKARNRYTESPCNATDDARCSEDTIPPSSEDSSVSDNPGAIAGLVILTICLCVAIVVGIYLERKRKSGAAELDAQIAAAANSKGKGRGPMAANPVPPKLSRPKLYADRREQVKLTTAVMGAIGEEAEEEEEEHEEMSGGVQAMPGSVEAAV